MNKLDVGFCFFEDSLDTVIRAIESIRYQVRYIFAVDGKYKDFTSDDPLSGGVIRGYLSSIDNVIFMDYPNHREPEKRQQYLNLAEYYGTEFLFILDADEFVREETDWDTFYSVLASITGKTGETFNILCKMDEKVEGWLPRIWHNPHDLEYMKTHNYWRTKSTGEIKRSSKIGERIEWLVMGGDDSLRDSNYQPKSYEYQKKMMKYEKPFRKQYH